jgi:hypothetical protein
MAADVEGEHVLDYEREGQAILQATRRLELNLVVEESGCLEFLEPCLVQEQPAALHLSCHGTIRDGAPVLALETPEGRGALATVAELRKALGEEGRTPALVFGTAEHGAVGAFTQALIRAGIDNAVGWDGSVYDADGSASRRASTGIWRGPPDENVPARRTSPAAKTHPIPPLFEMRSLGFR